MSFRAYVARAYGTTPDAQMLRELREEDEATLARRAAGLGSRFALTNQERMEQRQRDLESVVFASPQTAYGSVTAPPQAQPAPVAPQPAKAPQWAANAKEGVVAGPAPTVGGQGNRPATAKGARFELHGHPVSSVLRWMGANKWTKEEARKHLDANGCEAVSDSTIGVQLGKGKRGDEPYPQLSLSK